VGRSGGQARARFLPVCLMLPGFHVQDGSSQNLVGRRRRLPWLIHSAPITQVSSVLIFIGLVPSQHRGCAMIFFFFNCLIQV
jgi:hypothetical protein